MIPVVNIKEAKAPPRSTVAWIKSPNSIVHFVKKQPSSKTDPSILFWCWNMVETMHVQTEPKWRSYGTLPMSTRMSWMIIIPSFTKSIAKLYHGNTPITWDIIWFLQWHHGDHILCLHCNGKISALNWGNLCLQCYGKITTLNWEIFSLCGMAIISICDEVSFRLLTHTHTHTLHQIWQWLVCYCNLNEWLGLIGWSTMSKQLMLTLATITIQWNRGPYCMLSKWAT